MLDLDAGVDQLLAVLLEALERHVEGEVVHRRVGRREVALARQGGRVGDARDAGRPPREPEEREAVVVPDVEEEVLPAVRQVDRLDERHAQHIAVEPNRPRHVARHQRDVVDPAQLELLVRPHTARR